MIPRYNKKEISDIWTDQSKFEYMLESELAILKALEGNKVPKNTSTQIKNQAKIIPDRIKEIEKITKHDIIAFSTSITENLEPKIGKFFHYGVTSSDIIDSALTLQIKASLDIILPSYQKLLTALCKQAENMKEVITLGRSHGMYAEPMSFGQKILGHYCEFARHYADLKNFYQNDLTVQFSGAVGNYCILTPKEEQEAAQTLKLKVEPVSTQVIPRDRLAKLISINALVASAIERFAVEIRHLHHSDINELHEGFAKGQKGSSTMPHKKNPISAENLTGMARVLKSHLSIAHENIILWHERDISHSSAERFYLPDNFGILYYSLERLTSTVNNLHFHRDNIEDKVKNNFSYLSSYYLHKLISKTDLSREELYTIVQKAAFEGQNQNSKDIFFQTLKDELNAREIDIELSSPSYQEIRNIYLKSTPIIFERALKTYPLD